MRNSPQKFLTILARFLPVILILVLLLTDNAFSQTLPAIRQLIVEDIEIVGNNKTKPEVILRHLNFGVGDPIDPFVIDINNRRLSQTNFFKDVQFYTRRGSEKGKLVVILPI